LNHIVLPVLRLLPSVRSTVVCSDRREAELHVPVDPNSIYPPTYRPWLPRQPHSADVRERARAGARIWPLLQASVHARRMIAEYLAAAPLGDRRLIVITLRDYAYMPRRNSQTSAWSAFADKLDSSKYVVVFVPDADAALDPPNVLRHRTLPGAALDPDLRLALYEAAWLNLAVMHGPMELCWYSEGARYLLFVNVGAAPQNQESSLVAARFEIGKPLPFATEYQRIVWQSDDLETIEREFGAMARILERGASSGGLTAA
jgi:hypothetical protein